MILCGTEETWYKSQLKSVVSLELSGTITCKSGD